MAVSSAIPVALTVAHLTQLVALSLAGVQVTVGLAQRVRAAARSRDEKYRPYPSILSLIHAEVGVARLWITAGLLLVALDLLFPHALAIALIGAAFTAFVFLKGIGSAGRTAEAEADRCLSKGSAAEKCWRVQEWANWAASARLVPGTRCFHRLAHYSVPAGQIGPLHAAMLTAVGLCFFAYVSLGLAAGITQLVEQRQAANTPQAAKPASTPSVATDPGPFPTYAESCPELPDPTMIGHRLGRVFRHDGAAKAGCGGPAISVSGTDSWVAPGTCSRLNEMRSLAVSAPGQRPAILYGEAARFAWTAALEGELLGAEAARPDGGDVDVIETSQGNHVFARSSRSIGRGSENIGWCWEATGAARPFTHLPPPLAWLWLELTRLRGAWSWPADHSDQGDSISFTDEQTGELVARGRCVVTTSCTLEIGDELWPAEGTAFVSLPELTSYMPPESE